MATRQPSTQKTAKKVSSVKASDWLNFSSAIVIAVIASIFYYTGWVYISHWFSYYGIDASQINPSFQLITIHGIPGLFFLVITSLTAILGYAIYNALFYRRFIDMTDIPSVANTSYITALFLLSTTALILLGNQYSNFPPELFISFGFIIIMFMVRGSVDYLFVILAFIAGKPVYVSDLRIPVVMPNIVAWTISLYIMTRRAITNRDFSKIRKIYSLPPKPEILREMERTKRDFTRAARSQKVKLRETITKTQNYWIGTMLLFYFLISVSMSAVLGEWDATRGRRLMVGDWQIPKVELYSTTSMPSLEKYETEVIADKKYKYDQIGLLASDDKVYYLVDIKTTYYYTTRPNLYIIPRSENLFVNFIVSSNIVQTPISKMTSTPTRTPTLTPAITITPTP